MTSPPPEAPVRADAALTEIMPAIGRGRRSHWRGIVTEDDIAEMDHPGSSHLPGWHIQRTAQLAEKFADPQLALMARVLSGLRAL